MYVREENGWKREEDDRMELDSSLRSTLELLLLSPSSGLGIDYVMAFTRDALVKTALYKLQTTNCK